MQKIDPKDIKPIDPATVPADKQAEVKTLVSKIRQDVATRKAASEQVRSSLKTVVSHSPTKVALEKLKADGKVQSDALKVLGQQADAARQERHAKYMK